MANRRARILDAARALVRRGGMAGLSMRHLAEESGLAVKTLYNLWGGRDAIVEALVGQAVDEMEGRLAREASIEDPLERCRAVVTSTIRHLAEDAELSRAIVLTRYREPSFSGSERVGRVEATRQTLTVAIRDAIDRGLLLDRLDSGMLARQIHHGYEMARIEWAHGWIDEDGFRTRALYGLYVALLAVASESLSPDFEAELERLEQTSRQLDARVPPVGLGDAGSRAQGGLIGMEILRTPDERFAGLKSFPWQPRYREDLPGYPGLRMHFVDEGPADAEHTFLCLHGEPTWSYLYRKMIPIFLETGARVVAPDLFGFGRSDKPVEDEVYTFGFHRGSLLRLIEALDLRRITLVCQDWGGILGLTLPMEMSDRFARLLVMNTALPVGKPLGRGFAGWKAYAASDPDLPVAGLVALSSPGALAPPDSSAYGAPFPDQRYKAGVRRFPQLVPVEPGMEGADLCRAARDYLREIWTGPVRMAVGMADPILGPTVMEALRQDLRGCPEPLRLEGAGHFVQEWGEDVARWAVEEFARAES